VRKLLAKSLTKTLDFGGVELFVITSSTVNQLWRFFHCWKQQ